jgi:hypothetical protein
MNLYLDDSINKGQLADRLRNAGHQVVLPVSVGLAGAMDSQHFLFAIEQPKTLLTRDHEDFFVLLVWLALPEGNIPASLRFERIMTIGAT